MRPKKKLSKMKGDVYMRTITDSHMNDLKKRASQRRILFPNQKNSEDVKLEHDFFEDVQNKMYEQISEDEKWN